LDEALIAHRHHLEVVAELGLSPVVVALSLLTAFSILTSGSTSEAYRIACRVLISVIVALLYALKALFFHYGELRPSRSSG
jgi:hypothetical protein